MYLYLVDFLLSTWRTTSGFWALSSSHKACLLNKARFFSKSKSLLILWSKGEPKHSSSFQPLVHLPLFFSLLFGVLFLCDDDNSPELYFCSISIGFDFEWLDGVLVGFVFDSELLYVLWALFGMGRAILTVLFNPFSTKLSACFSISFKSRIWSALEYIKISE